jgi:hypothetical protein
MLYSSYLPLGVSQLAGHSLHHHRAFYSNQAPFVSTQREDPLVGLQQKDALVTWHEEAPLVSTQQEDSQHNLCFVHKLEGNSYDREHCNEIVSYLDKAPSDVAGTVYAPYFS